MCLLLIFMLSYFLRFYPRAFFSLSNYCCFFSSPLYTFPTCVCVLVYTTPSPAHVYCPNARFSHKVRLKIDWKFLVRLLKCLSLTANKMAAKNNKKAKNKKATSNAAATSHLWLQLSKEWERGRERKSGEEGQLTPQLKHDTQAAASASSPAVPIVHLLWPEVSFCCVSLSVLFPSLSRSSLSRFGNFSFVITVSAVDASQWQANCYQAVWKRWEETERGIQQRLRAV